MKNTQKKNSVYNHYDVAISKSGLMFKVLKTLSNGKKRVDSVQLNNRQIAELKKEAKKSKKAFFAKVNELVTKPCKLDSKAFKNGLCGDTGYCPSHDYVAKAIGVTVKK